MKQCNLEALGEGRFKVAGPLSFDTAGSLLQRSAGEFESAQRLELDLSGVTQSDSAGLALLVEWLRQGLARGQQVRFKNIPSQLLALAQISDLDELLLSNGDAH